MSDHSNTIIIGGGLAGLTAAASLARGGQRVTLLEGAQSLGGRARTQDKGGFKLNMGPHALYRQGQGSAVLKQLGIAVGGGRPNFALGGGYVLRSGRAHTFPAGPVSLLTTGALPLRAKLEVARLMSRLPGLDPDPLRQVTVAEWIPQIAQTKEARELIAALVRLTTYVNAPELLSAAVALRQVQMGIDEGVDYLDGGWQSLIESLASVASEAGAQVCCDARAKTLTRSAAGFTVLTSDGASFGAQNVVLAVAPATADQLLRALSPALGAPHAELGAPHAQLTPVHASCLDVALRVLPKPRRIFALGLDEPTYLSVHSTHAQLAEHGAVVHVAKYLAPGEAPATRAELESLLELMQPGWREHLVHSRMLPQIVVNHALPMASSRSPQRPDVRVPTVPGVYLAGDWVGEQGFLADAAFASASVVAQRILEQDAQPGTCAESAA